MAVYQGWSGVMARSSLEGVLQPETHVAERSPSRLSSLHSMRILDRKDLTVRMGCCVASDGLTQEEKGKVGTRMVLIYILWEIAPYRDGYVRCGVWLELYVERNVAVVALSGAYDSIIEYHNLLAQAKGAGLKMA